MIAARVPIRRPGLVLRECAGGGFTAKDPSSGAYFRLGDEETFLLLFLDGCHQRPAIKQAYRAKFKEELSDAELDQFVEMARREGLIELRAIGAPGTTPELAGPTVAASPNENPVPEPLPQDANPPARRQSILYWRTSLFDPDRLLSAMVKPLGFIWTRAFLYISAAAIVLAISLVWSNAHELAHHFSRSLTWQNAIVVWITLLAVTTIHEFGHGLTCKQHGGEVHEMGLLLMYFMPCLFCNVSDAWMIGDKRKQLWVTAAGGYVEMCLWAAAVFLWRLTMQDSFVNYLALAVITASGVRILLNCNPFLKLDGYYLLSDYLEIPNLRQQALARVAAWLRWLLWGAERPAPHPRAKTLVFYGVACWFFAVGATAMMLRLFGGALYSRIGVLGAGFVAVIALLAVPKLFRGLDNGEIRQMWLLRRRRLLLVLALLGGLAYALTVIPMEKRVYGTFEIRPLTRRDVRAPLAGFIREVALEEGQTVSASSLAARLEVPDLESRVTQKEAEVREVQAKLRLLQQGPRVEEVDEQQKRIARAAALRDQRKADLAHAQQALRSELLGMDQRITQVRAELDQALATARRTKRLLADKQSSLERYEMDRKHVEQSAAGLKQAMAEKAEREATGVIIAEQELALREKEYADELGKMDLLKAGAPQEKIEAEEARLARLNEELAYLHDLEAKRTVACGWQGAVVTPHIREVLGQYLNEGDLICTIEEVADLTIEIELPEQELRDVRPGQSIRLKARSLPFDTFDAVVDRIAPSAKTGDVQSSVVIHTHLHDPPSMLRPGMTGYARIECGQRPASGLLVDKLLQYVRTEFWW